jgi:hypothetical protein
VFDLAPEGVGVIPYPAKILFARARVDDQQVFVVAQSMHDHIVHKRPLGIQQRRILRLSQGQPRSIVHRNTLYCRQRFRPREPDIPHVADVEDTHAGAHGVVLRHNSAGAGILHRHVPSIEFDHLGAHLAMDGIQCGLADGRRGRLDCRQVDSLDQTRSGWAAKS